MVKFLKKSIFLIFIFSCSPNIEKKSNDWETLFNGIDLDDWTIKIANQELNYNY